MNKRGSLLYLALITLVASGLACNAPTPTPAPPPGPPPTVTSHPTSPTQVPPEATLTPESPEAAETETATTEAAPPTATSSQPPAATSTPTETPTKTPTPSPSEGPLDFVPPTWVQSWESLPNGQYRVVANVHITGGAPPFIIEHDHIATDDSPTQERDYSLIILTSGCGAIVHNITVKSADGQEISKDYYIGMDPQPWCSD
ncbi:MAG: hypothetical protein DRI77_09500 [Chloroflexi bacterium]|nr:MAG: hypothetical protein DRI77_09500 [Chloroflexota bacterium]